MMSSGSVGVPSAAELVGPAGHTAVRFCASETNFDSAPKRSSR
jgi:hypothetical protein